MVDPINSGYYNEALTYDVMGNILTLQRNSLGTVMDNLSYSYPSNSNKLSAVTDNSGNTAGFNGIMGSATINFRLRINCG